MTLTGLVVTVVGWEFVSVVGLRHFQYGLRGVGNSFEFLRGFSLFYLLAAIWTGTLLLGYGWSRSDIGLLRNRVENSRAANYLLLLTVIVGLAIAGELAVRFLLVTSHGNVNVLIHQNWMVHYWNPINELGYRDKGVRPLARGQRRVLVLGDSIASGWGVKNIEDTFAHVLEGMLGENYVVNVAAKPNWETGRQLEALSDYPVGVDDIVLSYVLNDIVGAAAESPSPVVTDRYKAWMENGVGYPRNRVFAFFFRNLYLPNLIYWSLPGSGDGGGLYMDYLLAAYTDPETWESHSSMLRALVEQAEKRNASLVVLLWPWEIDWDKSDQITHRVEEFFQSRRIAVFNMKEATMGLASSQLYASPFDQHPGVYRHKIAAAGVFRLMKGHDPDVSP